MEVSEMESKIYGGRNLVQCAVGKVDAIDTKIRNADTNKSN